MNHFAGDAGGVVDAGALGGVGATLDGAGVEGVAAAGRAVLGDDFGALAGAMDAGGVNDRGDVALGRGFGRALLVGDRGALGVGRSWMGLTAFKPDAYQAKMAKWMVKHMAMNQTASLDQKTALYLESVAWETWLRVHAQLHP